MAKPYNPKVAVARFRVTLSLVIVPGVNPHRFGFASALEAAFAIEIEGLGISHDDVLVEVFVAGGEHFHDLFSNSAAAIFGKNKKMRIKKHSQSA